MNYLIKLINYRNLNKINSVAIKMKQTLIIYLNIIKKKKTVQIGDI